MKTIKKLKTIPDFKTEAEEAEFWMTHDTTEYFDWSRAQVGYFPNLKPTTKLISLRLPTSLINQTKIRANKMDVPYQSLLKQFIAEGVAEKPVNQYRAVSSKIKQRKKKS